MQYRVSPLLYFYVQGRTSFKGSLSFLSCACFEKQETCKQQGEESVQESWKHSTQLGTGSHCSYRGCDHGKCWALPECLLLQRK